MNRLIRFVVCCCMLAAVRIAAAGPSNGLDERTAERLAAQYVASQDPAERHKLAIQLARFSGDPETVVRALSRRIFPPTAPGYYSHEHFRDKSLVKRRPDDLLYFLVPRAYRAERPTGLIVFLHGGGDSTPRTAPGATLDFADDDSPADTHLSGDMFDATGMIAVGPSAPWNKNTSYRWCVPEADDYLEDVIRECKRRFNIDADRVFLLGHSMGGFGAYHFAQRAPDRFAAVVANSGSWSLGYWAVIRGTPLCIVQGVHDARPGVRWHYTDIAYGRLTDKLLTAQHIEHTYLEQNGNHSIAYGRKQIAQFFASAKDLRRDPYYSHIALATPVGFSRGCRYPVVHNRWLTLDDSVAGDLTYDELDSDDDGTFSSWRLEHRTRKLPGAAIDAVLHSDNTIVATTQNVARFTVWLHPKMIDVSRPVTITVNGVPRFRGRVQPTLLTALESYERRHDWGLIYPMKVEVSVGP